MRFAEAREFVRVNFTDPSETVSQATEFSRDQYRKILYTLGYGREFTKHNLGFAGKLFLFAGCLRFDRWNPPGPYVLPHDDHQHFRRFLKTLEGVDGEPTNTSRFKLGNLKWDMFEALDRVPIESISPNLVNGWKARLDAIPKPSEKSKIREYESFKADCQSLIHGVESNSLSTHFRALLPVVPFEHQIIVSCAWKNLEVEVSLRPKHQIPGNTFTVPGGDSVAIPMEPSQWQHGVTETEISVAGLVDSRVAEPSLTSSQHSLASDNWPAMWVFVFELLDAILWQLRVAREESGKWQLSPNDLGALTWKLQDGDHVIDTLTQDPPGVTIKLVSGQEDAEREHLGILSPTPWFVRCRELATDYAATGETNEALFWLNIGAEALFDIRCRAMCAESSIAYEELSSGKSYWDKAREFVAEEIPEAADSLDWPDAPSGTPSWFTQIRELDEHVDLAAPCDQVLSKYATIHKYRNDVFHGTRRDRVFASEVSEAQQSLDWLIENFTLAEREAGHKGDT